MKLLLDENLPKKLKLDFTEHEIHTAFEKGWNSKKNGELLELMMQEEFDALLTFDKNLQYQQNFKKYPIAVIVLNAPDNAYITLKELVPQIKGILNHSLRIGSTEIKIKSKS